MSDTILFILEGNRTDPNILSSMWHNFFRNTSNSNFHVTYDTNIYILWNEIKCDKDLDILELLIERNEENKTTLEPIKKSISQTYLLFDYDGHAGEASDEDLVEMLHFFNEETENGKLFISYPMVEAIRHLGSNVADFSNLVFPIQDSTSYKELVNKVALFTNYSDISGDQWNFICSENLRKSNQIVNGCLNFPTSPESVNQLSILLKQIENHIVPNEEVSVLSSFPMFIYHHIGNNILGRFR